MEKMVTPITLVGLEKRISRHCRGEGVDKTVLGYHRLAA